MNPDVRFMRQALALAHSVATASPNPRVGAVLVRDGRVIARGAHRGPGTRHAEAAALQGVDAAGATLYVTLEPCSFHGRTPPCAPALAGAGIRRAVIAMQDPDPRVDGRGIAQLEAAGIEVSVGLLEGAARDLNRGFIHHRRTGRPLVVLKLALTLDGKLAAPDGSSRWITSAQSRTLVHEERARSDAVMVGAGTVLADDPSLSVRLEGASPQPMRVIVDARGRVSPSARVFDGSAPVLVATSDVSSHEVKTSWKEAGAEVLVLEGSPGGVELAHLLRELGARDLLQVYCEGGASLATSLLREHLVDRLQLHLGSKMVGGAGPHIGDLGIESITDALEWQVTAVMRKGNDILLTMERVT